MKKVFIFVTYLFAIIVTATILMIESILKVASFLWTLIGMFIVLLIAPLAMKFKKLEYITILFEYPSKYLENRIWIGMKVFKFYDELAQSIRK